jgi:ATP-dependent Lon protease
LESFLAMTDVSDAILPIVPLKEIVVFPNSITPLYIVRHQALLALDAALARDKRIVVITQRNEEVEHPGPKDLYAVGALAEVIQVLRLPDGSAKILVEGRVAGRVSRFLHDSEYLRGVFVEENFVSDQGKATQALQRAVIKQFENHVRLSEKIPEDLALSIKNLDEPLALALAVGNYCNFKVEDKQLVLEARKASDKLRILSELLAGENELLELENNIVNQVRVKIGKTQKEYFLSEQIKVIEKELGIGGEDDAELADYEDRVKKSRMSKEIRDKAWRELGRLSKMPQLSPEATVSRTYVDWLLDIPWGKLTKDQGDLDRARRVLDEDHYGLDKVKERIVEYLAVLKLVEHFKGPILCLVGPPGVGKTSLGRSIARALKRKFVRVSLGGVRDEAEIRGHRRTYIGSMPGKIVQMLKKAGSMNPVMLLDEIDKLGTDFRGDPASALLEVLDPEQNKVFNDHYMEVDVDLSRVMFVTTANSQSGIPTALMDRMELIRLPGYTEEEKRHIARNFLIPRQLKAHGLDRRAMTFKDDAVDKLIQNYSREAGVRELDRQVAAICRKVARDMVAPKISRPLVIDVDARFVREQLGPERYTEFPLADRNEVGVVTGLAWTEFGGEILTAEATVMPGKGILHLTGQLGDVMKESGQAAMSYLRSRAAQFEGIPKDFHKNLDIHVHFPEGAIPKDGPSAGVALVTVMLSALTGRLVRRDVAMTGEITLRGRVLKIGGLKEKILAAHRNGARRVILPADNMPELEEIPDDVRRDLEFIPARTVEEVLAIALVPASPKPAATKKPGAPSGRRRSILKPAKPLPDARRIQPLA